MGSHRVHETLPVLLAVLHHVDEQGKSEDKRLEAFAQRTEPVGHDEETSENPANATLLLPNMKAAVGLRPIVMDNVNVHSDQGEQGVPEHTSHFLSKERIIKF